MASREEQRRALGMPQLIRDDREWIEYRLGLTCQLPHRGEPPAYPCLVLTFRQDHSGYEAWIHRFVEVSDARGLLDAQFLRLITR